MIGDRIIRENGRLIDDTPSQGQDGSLVFGLAHLRVKRFSAMRTTDDNPFDIHFSNTRAWQESIAIEQLKTVHWLAIGI